MSYEQQLNLNKVITIGTSSLLVAEKSAKKVIYLRNTSTAAQVITLAFDNMNAAVAGTGLIIAPGEYVLDSNSEGYEAWNGQIKAIASAAGATLSVMITPEEAK